MITGLNHITLAVTDISQSFDFYANILGFKPLCRWNEGAYFLLGDLWFCLNLDRNRSNEPSPCYTHIAFSVSAGDFATTSRNLLDAGCKTFKDNTSEGDSFYFLDPDGHKLELHVGDWKTRIAHKKKDLGSWKDVEFFV